MERVGVRTITKKDLCERIAAATGAKRSAVKDVLDLFLEQIVSELAKGNRIEFREFGVFEIKTRAPRLAQNPRTLQRVSVPERRSVKFKPGSAMRVQIERPGEGDGGADGCGDSPLPEPKAGVRPDTGGLSGEVSSPANLDGKPARRSGQANPPAASASRR